MSVMFEEDPRRLRASFDAEQRERYGLEIALERITEQQPKTLAMIREHGFVFDSIGCEPGNWQHLAFSIYNDLCEVVDIARDAIAALPEPMTGRKE